MKKIFSLFIAILMFMTTSLTLPVSAFSEQSSKIQGHIISENTEYFPDGSYATIVITEDSPNLTKASVYTKKGTKYFTLHNSNGDELWRFTVNGTFTVNPGMSSTCTSSTYNIGITENAWQNKSAYAYRSKNQAVGDATFIKKLLLVTVETKSCHVVLTCDENGKLS